LKDRTKNIEIRLALCEQQLTNISNKLVHIDKNINELKKFANIGTGVWKAVFIIGALLGLILTFQKIIN
jgi:hypothetical protein